MRRNVVLDLYQTLLTCEGSPKGDRLHLDTLPDEDAVDKEAMQVELCVQKTYVSLLSEGKASLNTYIEVVWQLIEFYEHAYDLSRGKHAIAFMINAVKSAHTVEVDMKAMAKRLEASQPVTLSYTSTDTDPDNLSQMLNIRYLDLRGALLTRIYESPFCTKSEKLCVLIELITTRNRLKQMKAQHCIDTPESSQGELRDDG